MNHESWCNISLNLAKICNCIVSKYINEIDRLKAENARLKEALEYIAENKQSDQDVKIYGVIAYWDIAREALNSKNNT